MQRNVHEQNNNFYNIDIDNNNINKYIYNFSLFTDGDVLCFIDFRADRMRQINEAFGIKPPFETDVIPKDLVSIHRDIHVPLTETNIGMPRLHSTDCKSSLMEA